LATPRAGLGVAIFDLDGTITWHDTLVPYLRAVLQAHPVRLLHLWRVPWALLCYGFDRDRGRLKGALIRAVMAGLTRTEVAAVTRAFLDQRLGTLCRHTALSAIEAHRAEGDHLVLLSASPDLYVPEIGRRLGFDDTLCTGIRWDGEHVHGALATENRHGPEKVRCIAALRFEHPAAGFVAYGNAQSDFAHLLAVDAPLLVNPSASTRRRARALGLATADWS
jgi:phosphatidylglycerophosphatase C